MNFKDEPVCRISIITPTYNRLVFLDRCIRSVLEQDYPWLEHIFIDGNSKDGTVELLAEYQARYPDRLRYISEPDNGIEEAFNKGLKLCHGDIIGGIGSDDELAPGAATILATFFSENPDAKAVFGDCDFIDEDDNFIQHYQTCDFDLDDTINNNCHVPYSSLFYRREVSETIGGLDTKFKMNDVDLCIRIGRKYKLHRLPYVISKFRIHEDKRGTSAMQLREVLKEYFIMSRWYGAGIWSPRARRYYLVLVTDIIRWPLVRFYHGLQLQRLVDWLRPMMGFVYPPVTHLLKKLTIRR